MFSQGMINALYLCAVFVKEELMMGLKYTKCKVWTPTRRNCTMFGIHNVTENSMFYMIYKKEKDSQCMNPKFFGLFDANG